MSTEPSTAKRSEGVAGARALAAYETRDFYLACFLRCLGYELLDLRPEGRRRVFVFRDRQARRDDVMAFYGPWDGDAQYANRLRIQVIGGIPRPEIRGT